MYTFDESMPTDEQIEPIDQWITNCEAAASVRVVGRSAAFAKTMRDHIARLRTWRKLVETRAELARDGASRPDGTGGVDRRAQLRWAWCDMAQAELRAATALDDHRRLAPLAVVTPRAKERLRHRLNLARRSRRELRARYRALVAESVTSLASHRQQRAASDTQLGTGRPGDGA